MNGVHSNAAGFRRWLEGRDARPPPDRAGDTQVGGVGLATVRASDDELGPQLLLADLEVVQ